MRRIRPRRRDHATLATIDFHLDEPDRIKVAAGGDLFDVAAGDEHGRGCKLGRHGRPHPCQDDEDRRGRYGHNGRGHAEIVLLIHDHYDMAKSTGIGLHFDAWQRYFGYSQAMQAAGLQSIVITHSTPADVNANEAFFASGMASLDHVIGHETLPTAVVCYNDYQAYGLIRGCRLRNIPIPEQLSIVGYGDLELSQITSPTLTTLRVPAWQVGYQATRMLLDLLAHANVEETLVPSELRLRESTTRPRKHS